MQNTFSYVDSFNIYNFKLRHKYTILKKKKKKAIIDYFGISIFLTKNYAKPSAMKLASIAEEHPILYKDYADRNYCNNYGMSVNAPSLVSPDSAASENHHSPALV